MGVPAGYQVVPHYVLELNEPLRATLFIHMIANETVLRFRDKGQELEFQDLAKLKEFGQGRILVMDADYQAILQTLSDELGSEPFLGTKLTPPGSPSGPPSEPPRPGASPPSLLTKAASASLQGMGALLIEEDPAKVAQRIKQTLEEGSRLLSDVILKSKSLDASRSSIEKYLASLRQDPSPLAAHGTHVSALAGLILLTFFKATQQNLTDLVLAGIFHDVCLGEIPPSFMTNHFGGKDLGLEAYRVFSQETMIRNYIQHIELAMKRIQELNVPLSETSRKIITQHHENLDGSGLFKLDGKQIHPLAKILRIADDAIVCVQNPQEPCSLLAAVDRMRAMNEEVGDVYYDVAILTPLLKLLGGA